MQHEGEPHVPDSHHEVHGEKAQENIPAPHGNLPSRANHDVEPDDAQRLEDALRIMANGDPKRLAELREEAAANPTFREYLFNPGGITITHVSPPVPPPEIADES